MPDGRYRFSFYDNGKKRAVYSWKLERTDKTPTGKRDGLSLREKEAQHQKQAMMQVAFNGGNMTVLDLVRKYTELKKNVKHTTRTGYKTVIRWLEKDPFARKRIDSVRTMDAKEWLIRLQEVDGKSYSSIQTIRGVVRPAFAMAVENDLIVKNPFDFMLVDVVVNDSVRREAVSKKDMRRFLEFVKNDKHYSKYYEAFYVLFWTGMRISEFCGLTLDDVDLEKREIRIDHQLQRSSEMEYMIIPSPKTDAGNRTLPMDDGVYECMKKVVEERKKNKKKKEPMVDGRSGFLYLDANGLPCVALHWEHRMKLAVEKHNKIYKDELPSITPHVCRHTYCSMMARSGMMPKTLQYLMGHSDIGVTLNTYTHLGLTEAKEDVRKLQEDGVMDS